jgi:hypothetical protein
VREGVVLFRDSEEEGSHESRVYEAWQKSPLVLPGSDADHGPIS